MKKNVVTCLAILGAAMSYAQNTLTGYEPIGQESETYEWQEPENMFYLSGTLNIFSLAFTSEPNSTATEFDILDKGALAVGCRLDTWLRLELEGSGSRGRRKYDGGSTYEWQAFQVIGQAYVDFPLEAIATPYLQIGLGFGHQHTSWTGGRSSNDFGFGYNLGIGISFPISQTVSFDTLLIHQAMYLDSDRYASSGLVTGLRFVLF